MKTFQLIKPLFQPLQRNKNRELFLVASLRQINELMRLKQIPTFYTDLKHICLDASKQQQHKTNYYTNSQGLMTFLNSKDRVLCVNAGLTKMCDLMLYCYLKKFISAISMITVYDNISGQKASIQSP